MTDYQPYLGEILKELRAEEGAGSQDDLAAKAGVDSRTVRGIEKGNTYQENSLALICKGLNTTSSNVKMLALERMSKIKLKEAEVDIEDSTASKYSEIRTSLDDIDQAVREQHGRLISPTRATNDDATEFSSRRLVTSLASLGIPLDVTFLILEALPGMLKKLLKDEDEFTTGQIRVAVAKCISALRSDQLIETEVYQSQLKLEHKTKKELLEVIKDLTVSWAKRYARRYGNPSQITQVLLHNGSVVNLDYQFLKNELIPHLLRRIFGDDFSISTSTIVNPSVVSEMAQSTLEEFRRLGLYTIRYRTALWMAEDIAIHPPHPWIVSENTRTQTIEYDLERASANLEGLNLISDHPLIDIQHRYDETIHHFCSAILAVYSGFLGHKYTSPIHVLRHWLAMSDENTVLWQRCNLRYIDSDLASLGISKQDFLGRLKTMETANLLSEKTDKTNLRESCMALQKVALGLYARRNEMNRISNAIASKEPISEDDFVLIAKETAISSLGAKKIGDITERSSGSLIGFRGTPKIKDSVLSHRASMCIFLTLNDAEKPKDFVEIVERAADQLYAHRLSNTCIIMTRLEPNDELKKTIDQKLTELPAEFLIAAVSVDSLRTMKANNIEVKDILDILFADG